MALGRCPASATMPKSRTDGGRAVQVPFKPLALAGLLVASVLVAGCSGGSKTNDGTGGTGDRQTAGDGTDPSAQPLPTWAVGDFWTYTFNGAPTTYVITTEDPKEWIMETDSAE